MTDTPPSSVVGIDEIAVRKGHVYETVVTDILTGKVHRMGKDRDTESARSLLRTLDDKPIKTFVMDMWQPYYNAVTQLFPDVSIVIDKYHVVQKIN